jgi:hypothetical protein
VNPECPQPVDDGELLDERVSTLTAPNFREAFCDPHSGHWGFKPWE